MDISFQLYSARGFTPWEGVLDRLAALGYTQVEGYGGVYEDPEGFRAALDARGLAMPSGHFSLDLLEADPGRAADIAGTLGMARIYCPHVAAEARPSDGPGWAAFAHRLARVGEQMTAQGFAFGWHNHDFELRPCADGAIPMEVILSEAPLIDWEADVAWIVRGGADPLAWIERHGARLTAAHVKDIAPEGQATDEDGWADVGHGTLDWAAITAALRAHGVSLFVLEHDKPSDFDRFASRSIAAFRQF